MADTTASDALATTLAGPRRSKVDNLEVEAQPIADLIEADRYLATKDADGKARRGLRFTQLKPPGTV